MAEIFYIGGSPCSGKSTVAEILSRKYDLYYFKVDDFLEKYLKSGAAKGYKICKEQMEMSVEQTWMREPKLQCQEEILFYQEIFELIQADLSQIRDGRNIITEGAAYLPELMKQLNVPAAKYISIVPEKEFQISHYKQREWVPYILQECSDKEQAFLNWMDRDALFALEVRRQCEQEEYPVIVVDGKLPVEEVVRQVSANFGLE